MALIFKYSLPHSPSLLTNSIDYIQFEITMGNNPNKIIQCGVSDKDTKQEVYTTREEAIRGTKNPASLLRPSLNNKSNPKNLNQFIPQHENLTTVSRTHQRDLIEIQNGNYYEDVGGKCLDQIIQSRYHTSMHFPEEQVVALLQAMVYSLAYLCKKSIPHHDFYPTNIFYRDGIFRVRNPMGVICSAYAITQQRQRFSFLAPELIQQILAERSQSQIPQQMLARADVFGIGMVLLEFCSLQPSAECYDEQTYRLIQERIRQRIFKCSKIYHPLVAHVLDMMLQLDPVNRIPPLELAYQVHAKLRQMKRQNIGEPTSRIIFPPNIMQHPPQQQPRIVGMPIPSIPPQQLMLDPHHNRNMPPPPGMLNMQMKPPFPNMERDPHKLNPFELIKEDDNEDEESPNKTKEESLDERVRRILDASRNIR